MSPILSVAEGALNRDLLSLPHWLAYWAIGWQMTATYYRDKIVELLAKMFAMRPRIHNANTEAVLKYLLAVYKRSVKLTSSFNGT